MPRKPYDGAPMQQEGKMSDETRKELFGKSEKETAPSDQEGVQERQREYSGASNQGTPATHGSDKHSQAPGGPGRRGPPRPPPARPRRASPQARSSSRSQSYTRV
jgi:hypothetical protein